MGYKRSVLVGWITLVLSATGILAQTPSSRPAEFPLADRIPASSLFYFGWAGQNKTLDASKFGQVMNDPATADAASQLTSFLSANMPPQARPIIGIVTGLGGVLARHPVAIALIDLQPAPGQKAKTTTKPSSLPSVSADPLISAVLMADLGKDKEVFDKVFLLVKAMIPSELQKQEGNFTVLATPTKVAFGYVGETFILAVGDKTLETVTKLSREKSLLADKTFTSVMSEVGVDKAKGKSVAPTAQLGLYADAQRLAKAIVECSRDSNGDPNEIVESLNQGVRIAGLAKVASVAVSMRVVDEGMFTTMRVTSPAPHAGVLGLFSSNALKDADLENLPADALLAGAFKFSATDMLGLIAGAANEFEEGAGKKFEKALEDAKKETGVSIKDDILASLGDTWTYFTVGTSETQEGLAIVSVQTKDAQKLSATLAKLEDYANKNAPPGIRFVSQESGELKIHVLELPASTLPPTFANLKPAWCVFKDRLYFSLTPEWLSKATTNGDKPLAQERTFTAARSHLNEPSSFLGYLDASVFLSHPEGLFSTQAQLPPSFVEGFGETLAKLRKYFQPEMEIIRTDKNGLTVENYSTFPSGRLGATPLVAVSTAAILVPTMTRARQLARHAASLANLSAIGKGIAMYQSVHGEKFPKTFQDLVDANLISGQALISPLSQKPYCYIYLKDVPKSAVIVAYDSPADPTARKVPVLMSDGTAKTMDKATFEVELKKSQELAKTQGEKSGTPK